MKTLIISILCFGLLTVYSEEKVKCEDGLGTAKNRQEAMALMKELNSKAPKVGTEAPDFTLKEMESKQSFTLSSMKGKKPVVLIFGSYT